MNGNDQEKNIAKTTNSVPTTIHFGPVTSIDLSFMSDDERKALQLEYTRGLMDLHLKATELNVDAAILKRTLDDLCATTRDASASGNAVTITHTQDTKVGRTEVIMGNTMSAKIGKLSKSQTGERDWTPYYILAGILALVIIVALMSS